MPPLMNIDLIVEKLLQKAIAKGYSRRSLAIACGLSENAFRDMDFSKNATKRIGTSNLTISTLRFIEKIVGSVDSESVNHPLINRHQVIYQSRKKGEKSDNKKSVIPVEMLPFVDSSIAQAKKYLEKICIRNNIIHSNIINYKILSDIAPEVKCHIVNVGEDLHASAFERWHTVSDYRQGYDLTGMRIAEDLDQALADCFGGDCLTVSESGIDQLAAIERTLFWPGCDKPVDRSVVRSMGIAIGPHDTRQVVTLARLQKSATSIQTVRSLVTAHEN